MNVAWAYASLHMHDPGLMQAVAARAVDPAFLPTFTAQGVANLAWSFATLQVRSEGLMARLADRAMAPDVLASYGAHHLSMTAWAFARLDIPHAALLDALAGRAVEVVGAFNPQSIVITVWAFAQLRHRQEALFTHLAQWALDSDALLSLDSRVPHRHPSSHADAHTPSAPPTCVLSLRQTCPLLYQGKLVPAQWLPPAAASVTRSTVNTIKAAHTSPLGPQVPGGRVRWWYSLVSRWALRGTPPILTAGNQSNAVEIG